MLCQCVINKIKHLSSKCNLESYTCISLYYIIRAVINATIKKGFAFGNKGVCIFLKQTCIIYTGRLTTIEDLVILFTYKQKTNISIDRDS